MNKLITDFLIAIALSMDAFSISICIATSSKLSKKKLLFFSIVVGILHFIMPFLGNSIGMLITLNLEKIANYILAVIFLILSIELITSKENNCYYTINYAYLALIALTVSIDSFTIGLGLSLTNEYTLLASFIFSVTSFIFTIMGLTIGRYLNKHVGKKASLIGSILLFILSIKYFLKK